MKKKKVMQWQKSLTTAWHNDNSETSNLAMQKTEKQRNYYVVPQKI